MSNASMIERMEQLLDAFDPNLTDPYEFQSSVEFHMLALEGVGLEEVRRSRDLATRNLRSHFFDGGEEFGKRGDAELAIAEFKDFLSTLPARPT